MTSPLWLKIYFTTLQKGLPGTFTKNYYQAIDLTTLMQWVQDLSRYLHEQLHRYSVLLMPGQTYYDSGKPNEIRYNICRIKDKDK